MKEEKGKVSKIQMFFKSTRQYFRKISSNKSLDQLSKKSDSKAKSLNDIESPAAEKKWYWYRKWVPSFPCIQNEACQEFRKSRWV